MPASYTHRLSHFRTDLGDPQQLPSFFTNFWYTIQPSHPRSSQLFSSKLYPSTSIERIVSKASGAPIATENSPGSKHSSTRRTSWSRLKSLKSYPTASKLA
ncbi:hypothetical protein HanRHA438_Chr12g0546951 [Helianthus annuus]|nr:hypothetical protein HanRHA438_Chr12g0546951 [Helianthus annuus]